MTMPITDKDVTDQVDFSYNDDECLPLTKCVCGKTWNTWTYILSIYRDTAHECPQCGRRLYFRPHIKVYEVIE